MSDATPTLTNLERLKSKLKKDSLAARLVSAQINAGPAAQQAALKKVISDRLNELRQGYVGIADHQD